jgi:hypothetical protein
MINKVIFEFIYPQKVQCTLCLPFLSHYQFTMSQESKMVFCFQYRYLNFLRFFSILLRLLLNLKVMISSQKRHKFSYYYQKSITEFKKCCTSYFGPHNTVLASV